MALEIGENFFDPVQIRMWLHRYFPLLENFAMHQTNRLGRALMSSMTLPIANEDRPAAMA
jgi:hypothetical protein